MRFSKYPRTLSGILLVALCVSMAAYSFRANILISAGLLLLAALRSVVLVQDFRRARALKEEGTEPGDEA